jgi:hypothetical protein
LLASDEIPFGRCGSFPASFRGRPCRAHDKRPAQGAIGFYCCARRTGENRPG